MMAETDALLDATTALIPPLLNGLEALNYAGRHMHPPNLVSLVESVKPYREPLKQGIAVFDEIEWPEHLTRFRDHVRESANLTMQSFNEFLSSINQSQPPMAAYRAMGFSTKAIETLYPVSMMLPPVSRFYLDVDRRDDQDLIKKLAEADGTSESTGVMHANNTREERGGFSIYVPEYYSNEKVPLVICMHGGSGHGRSFLWTWLRTSRTRNFVLISPTSMDGTWSLMGEDRDSAVLDRLVDYAIENWSIDEDRILLTGMSDGGTFSYVSGLRSNAPFTHLAPCSASFHPMLVEMSDQDRLKGLPIYLMHGALDWMFPVEMARQAKDTFEAAGALIEYREIDDLSHTYPFEENPKIIDWLMS